MRRALTTTWRAFVGLTVAVVSLGVAYAFIQNTVVSHERQAAPPDVAIDESITASWTQFAPYHDAIPVLVYHDVSATPGPYSITPELFAEHMRALRRGGFETVTLEQVAAVVHGENAELPPRPLLLTFDDGPSSNWQYVDPILNEEGFNAVAFVVTGSIVDSGRSYYLSWQQLRDMHKSGRWEFGIHTDDGHHNVQVAPGRYAPWLINLQRSATEAESIDQWQSRVTTDLSTAIDKLAAHVGQPEVSVFSYPFAAVDTPTNDDRIPALVQQIIGDRFDLAFTSGSSTVDSVEDTDTPTRLPRYSISAGLSGTALLQHLAEMVPSPLPSSIGEVAWVAKGGSCDLNDGALRISGGSYTTCTPQVNSSQWQDYDLVLDVLGANRNATAIIALRQRSGGRVEVVIGEGEAKLRELNGDGWRDLAAVRLPTERRPEPTTTPRHMRISLRGQNMAVSFNGAAPVSVMLSDESLRGGFSFALAAHDAQSIEFRSAVIDDSPSKAVSAPMEKSQQDDSARNNQVASARSSPRDGN